MDEFAGNSNLSAPLVSIGLARRFRMMDYAFQLNRTKLLFAEALSNALNNSREPKVRMAAFPRFSWADALKPNLIGKQCVYPMCWQVGRTIDYVCAIKSLVTAARLIVACDEYRRQHGDLPPTLQDLVPSFIFAVPSDPFDGKPFRYSREKKIIYSVGLDMKDAGGSTQMADAYSRSWFRAEDFVWNVDGSGFSR
jgi:hypothetical protein